MTPARDPKQLLLRAAWMRNHGGDILERGIIEEASGGGKMDEESQVWIYIRFVGEPWWDIYSIEQTNAGCVGGRSPTSKGGSGGIRNPQKRTRRHTNNSPNMPSQTNHTQGRNNPAQGKPHFDIHVKINGWQKIRRPWGHELLRSFLSPRASIHNPRFTLILGQAFLQNSVGVQFHCHRTQACCQNEQGTHALTNCCLSRFH